MLLKKTELAAIKAGDLSVVFRKWRRPTVKTGGTLKTAIGLLGIDQVAKINRSAITERDARAAGCDSLPDLLANLDTRSGELYRIEVRFLGTDPRIALRNRDDLDRDELDTIQSKLHRLDTASRVGAWTMRVLLAIEHEPHTAAAALSERTGYEKDWLKINIRKLKNLGLTISHQPGYELSPRGVAVLTHLKHHHR